MQFYRISRDVASGLSTSSSYKLLFTVLCNGSFLNALRDSFTHNWILIYWYDTELSFIIFGTAEVKGYCVSSAWSTDHSIQTQLNFKSVNSLDCLSLLRFYIISNTHFWHFFVHVTFKFGCLINFLHFFQVLVSLKKMH